MTSLLVAPAIMVGIGFDFHGWVDGLRLGASVSVAADVIGDLVVRLDETNAFSSVVETGETYEIGIGSVKGKLRVPEAAVRKGQPVTVVIGNDNPELIRKLAGAGIISVDDISRLSSNRIRELERERVIETGAANELVRAAKDFLEREG